MAYDLEGQLLEVCDCKTLCPCWVGDDPDNGTCKGTLAWRIDRGSIDGLDVSGLTFAALAHIPGNIMNGNWKVLAFIDERASKEQEEAIVGAWTGKKGGPLADLSQLIGEVVGLERVPVEFEVREGKGSLRLGKAIAADMEPFRGPNGEPTALTNSIFSTIPGSPAYVGKATKYSADAPALGIKLELSGHNSVQGSFRFTA